MRKLFNESLESVRIALEQINEHRMRSLLTTLGVIIGIIAVTLMGTAINGIDIGFKQNIDKLGPNTLYVENWPWRDVGDEWQLYRNRPEMRLKYANELNDIIYTNPDTNLRLAVPVVVKNDNVTRGDRSAGWVRIEGTNSEFALTDNADLLHGRFMTAVEIMSGSNVVVIGYDIAEALFPGGLEQAIGETIKIRRVNYTVIGIYARQGRFLGGFSFDQKVIIPMTTFRKHISNRWWGGYVFIRIEKHPDSSVDESRDEIVGMMRRIRQLDPIEKNNFEVNQTDILEKQFEPVKRGIAFAGLFVTGLALFVGAIGIMNITFVSVRERTKEIGTRRAIGARRRSILMQFLTEASMICLLGGFIGLALTYGLQKLISSALPDFPVVMSPDLIIIALVISILTGVISGFAPALQASKLDPAEALRHE